MSLNWMEINQVLEELHLEGYFLQDIRQSDYQNTYLNLYRPGQSLWLLVSLAQGKTRIHSLSKKPAFLKKPPRFVEFLRSRIMGGKVQKALQWGRERIVQMEIATSEGVWTLWIRLWGGAANILVTGPDQIIQEAAFRRPRSSEVKGALFTPPPLPDYTLEQKKTFTLRDFPGEGSFNQKLEVFYAGSSQEADLDRLISQVKKRLEGSLYALEEALVNLKIKRAEYLKKEDWKTYGDLITAYAHEILPGQKSWEGEDFRDGSVASIPLDPTLTPWENAQKFYKQYTKARDGEERLEEDILKLEADISQLETRLDNLSEETDLQSLKKQLETLAPPVQSKKENQPPGLEFASGPYRILVGRTAKENDQLLRRYVRGGDIWLHTRDVPGGYVFIKMLKEKTVPLATLIDAGQLALHYSKAKSDGQADLYYTFVKYLRRAKDGPLGLVLPTQEKNLHIHQDPSIIQRLQRSRRGNDSND